MGQKGRKHMTEQRRTDLARSDERPTDLAQYDAAQYNVLAPVAIIQPDDVSLVRQSIAMVKLDPDVDKGDCYAAPGTRWQKNAKGDLVPDMVAPAKAGLMKLASAMGMRWRTKSETPRSHELAKQMAAGMGAAAARELFDEIRYDVSVRAQVAVRDGLSWRVIEATYEWELESQKRKIRGAAAKAAEKHAKTKAKFDSGEWKKKPANWTDEFDEEGYIARRLDEVIAERHGLAETKAIQRAVRATGIRHQYPRAEFAKPFVMHRVELAPDMSDPEVRKALAEKAVQSGNELFGDSSQQSTVPQIVDAARTVDFDAAEREGRVEQAAPVDGPVMDAEVTAEGGPGEWPGDDAAEPAGDGPGEGQPASLGGEAFTPICCDVCSDEMLVARINWCQSDAGKAALEGIGLHVCSTCQQRAAAKAKAGAS